MPRLLFASLLLAAVCSAKEGIVVNQSSSGIEEDARNLHDDRDGTSKPNHYRSKRATTRRGGGGAKRSRVARVVQDLVDVEEADRSENHETTVSSSEQGDVDNGQPFDNDYCLDYFRQYKNAYQTYADDPPECIDPIVEYGGSMSEPHFIYDGESNIRPRIVLYYEPDCYYSQQLKPIYVEFAKNMTTYLTSALTSNEFPVKAENGDGGDGMGEKKTVLDASSSRGGVDGSNGGGSALMMPQFYVVNCAKHASVCYGQGVHKWPAMKLYRPRESVARLHSGLPKYHLWVATKPDYFIDEYNDRAKFTIDHEDEEFVLKYEQGDWDDLRNITFEEKYGFNATRDHVIQQAMKEALIELDYPEPIPSDAIVWSSGAPASSKEEPALDENDFSTLDHDVSTEDHDASTQDHDASAEDYVATAQDHEVTTKGDVVSAPDRLATPQESRYVRYGAGSSRRDDSYKWGYFVGGLFLIGLVVLHAMDVRRYYRSRDGDGYVQVAQQGGGKGALGDEGALLASTELVKLPQKVLHWSGN